LKTLARVDLPAHLADALAYGSVMDTTRLDAAFGWTPAYSSRQAMDAFAAGKHVDLIESPSPPQEYELQVYLQQRRRRALRLSN
jgi:hypothetical protein